MGMIRIHNLRRLALFFALAASGCATIVSPNYGVREGHLAGCPNDRDCVSSEDHDPDHYIAPLDYTSDRDQARTDLIGAINALGSGRIVSNHRNYIRAEYPTPGHAGSHSPYYYQPDAAVDEVEFYFSPSERTVEIRSIAKLGLLGAGEIRDRLEKIRAIFERLQQQGSE